MSKYFPFLTYKILGILTFLNNFYKFISKIALLVQCISVNVKKAKNNKLKLVYTLYNL